MLPAVTHAIDGWTLAWTRLTATPGAGGDALAGVAAEVVDGLRQRVGQGALSDLPVAEAVRKLFRQAGTDPTRYRPSSEALARRVLRGDPFPRLHPLVDLNNLISIATLLPCCVMREAAVLPPFVLRHGAAGEEMESLRGPLALEGKTLIADREGPFSTPITDSRRVALAAGDHEALLVVYAPIALKGDRVVAAAIASLARRTSVAAAATEVGWTA